MWLSNKHYKAELKEIMERENISEEEAEKKSALMAEAREMLRKWEAGDEEVRGLWKMMNGWVYAGFDETYRRLGVDFDKIYYESDTYLEGKDLVLGGIEKGIVYRKDDGSVYGLTLRETVLTTSCCCVPTALPYMTQDIGTRQTARYQDFRVTR